MMRLFRTWLFIISVLLPAARLSAQEVAIKTNVLYWATTTPNLGVELALNKRATFNITGSYNPWKFGGTQSNKKIKHWVVQPEFRLWSYERFLRNFWGFHAFYGQYNIGGIKFPLDIFRNARNRRYQGWTVGAGVNYGHQWYLGPHWNLEATFGFGYAYMKYSFYESPKCGIKLGEGHKHYFGPTQIGVSFVYLFKSKK